MFISSLLRARGEPPVRASVPEFPEVPPLAFAFLRARHSVVPPFERANAVSYNNVRKSAYSRPQSNLNADFTKISQLAIGEGTHTTGEKHVTGQTTTDDPRIIGVWRLARQVYEDVATGEQIPIFGEKPVGRQIATPEGRWIALATAEGRTPPKTEAERSQALLTMVAYTGRYRLEAGVVTTKVEAAWQQSWVGGEQTRFVKFEGNDVLHIISATMPHPNLLDRTVRVLVTWLREE
jgi:hypothetical protein